MVLLLDRRTKRGEPINLPGSQFFEFLQLYISIFITFMLVVPVILENLDEVGQRSASDVKVDSLAVNTPLKSLIILVHQTLPNPRVDVYVDCVYEGSIPFKKTFRNIAEFEGNPEVVSFYLPEYFL